MVTSWFVTDAHGTLTVLFDADCGFCDWTARILRKLDRRGRLHLVPLQAAALPGQPGPESLRHSLHATDAHGRWWTGVDACVQIAERVPPLRPLARLARFRLTRPVFDRGYELIARNRHRVGAMLGLEACPNPSESHQRVGATGGGGRHR